MYLSNQRGMGDVCTQYDDHDNCIAWTKSAGGGAYGGTNLNNVDAPGFFSEQTGGLPVPTTAQQQQMIADQLGVAVWELPGYKAPTTAINPMWLVGGAGLVLLVVLLGGRRR